MNAGVLLVENVDGVGCDQDDLPTQIEICVELLDVFGKHNILVLVVGCQLVLNFFEIFVVCIARCNLFCYYIVLTHFHLGRNCLESEVLIVKVGLV